MVEQLKNFAQPGDPYMAISGSGDLPNVVNAMEYANAIGGRTLALSGETGTASDPSAGRNITSESRIWAHRRRTPHQLPHDWLPLMDAE
jgi:phosphoheptose isomerase